MFNGKPGESVALNWRGPLLAAGVFAAAFAILLLMAHQNEANSSDMGSSLREDPYGTSLVFDSYARAGYLVKRGQEEDSLSDEDASNTTAFFIGGYPAGDWKIENGKMRVGEKFRRRLEDFLARGGHAVLVAPNSKVMSESQHWAVENQWNQTAHAAEPTWVSPDPHTLALGSDKMYLSADAPWLETDAGWTALYATSANANGGTDSSGHVYMAARRVGSGELIAASQESFLWNEAVKARPNPVLLDFLVAGRPVVWVDETLHGLRQDEGVLWLIRRYRLQASLLLFWATLLVLLWSMGGDLVQRPAADRSAEIVRHNESAGVAARRLLQRSIAPQRLMAECWEQFRRRSPQDAQAISGDPHLGPRLRAALAQSPLTGYRQLSRIIAERRASAKGLGHRASDAPDRFKVLQPKGSEEAPSA